MANWTNWIVRLVRWTSSSQSLLRDALIGSAIVVLPSPTISDGNVRITKIPLPKSSILWLYKLSQNRSDFTRRKFSGLQDGPFDVYFTTFLPGIRLMNLSQVTESGGHRNDSSRSQYQRRRLSKKITQRLHSSRRHQWDIPPNDVSSGECFRLAKPSLNLPAHFADFWLFLSPKSIGIRH